jgi:small-conductance mechanosensitive channel
MIRRILALMICLLLAAPAARAQTKPAAPAPVQAAITPDQARAALDVLSDPKKRAAFEATLDAIVKAQPAAAAPAASPAPATTTPATKAETTPAAAHPAVEGLPIPLAPDSLGAQVLVTASDFVNQAGVQAMTALRAVQSVPLLWGWVVVMVTNPWARDLLVDVAWRLAVALVVAAAVELILRRLMRRPIASLAAFATPERMHDAPEDDEAGDEDSGDPEANAAAPGTALAVIPDDNMARAEAGDVEAPEPRHRRKPSAWALLRRLPLVFARLLLDLVPVLGLTIAGHLVAGSMLGGQNVSRLAILAVIDAYAACAALLCVARMLLSPRVPRLRLFHLPDDAADYLMRWIRRLIIIAVCGYAAGEVGLLLGLSDLAHDAVQKSVGLILHICVAVIVIQKRRRVRAWLRAPTGASGPMAELRNRFAAVWHYVALFFLVSVWLVYAVEVPHGFAVVLRYFALSVMVMILARFLMLVLLGFVDRALRVGPETAERYPGIDARLKLYHPALVAMMRGAVYLLVALSLLQIYGLGGFTWLIASALGQRILSAVMTSVVTILLGFAVWEGVNAMIQSHLAKLQREAQVARSARLRTLLPLFRSALLIAILVFAGLMVLSEIGVNIAPLLAGAGIVGVAIGFGSQKLVQDLITGIFLLLENAMQVGDWVTVSGLSGSVEALSVRTIRLRAGDGSVHIIPFSAVTSVTNVNRGLGNAAVNVEVDYDVDTDMVSDVLKQIVSGMRAEPEFSDRMLSDLQLWGVDKVDGASVTIAGQVVCTDSGRWAVQREFNRRMKKRFQELGIRVYNPMRSIALTGGLTVVATAEHAAQEAPNDDS